MKLPLEVQKHLIIRSFMTSQGQELFFLIIVYQPNVSLQYIGDQNSQKQVLMLELPTVVTLKETPLLSFPEGDCSESPKRNLWRINTAQKKYWKAAMIIPIFKGRKRRIQGVLGQPALVAGQTHEITILQVIGQK